jgi:hypothetical protein
MPPGWECRPRPKPSFPFSLAYGNPTRMNTMDRYSEISVDLYGQYIFTPPNTY